MKQRMSRAVQVLVAVPSARVARRISEGLLEKRLCACAQTLGPVTSQYRWKGRLESAREWLLLIKTRASLSTTVVSEIRRLHPYEVPEILVLPVSGGHGPYLDWLRRETASTPRARSKGRVRRRVL